MRSERDAPALRMSAALCRAPSLASTLLMICRMASTLICDVMRPLRTAGTRSASE